MAHGISTTIVEIDPVVYDFAQKYFAFALPPGHTAVIADAVTYASQLAKTEQRFDYIVHDVFTGGAEPVDLFTLEFIQDLHSILKPGGVIAIVSLVCISVFLFPVELHHRTSIGTETSNRTTPAISSSPQPASSSTPSTPSFPAAASSASPRRPQPTPSQPTGGTSPTWLFFARSQKQKKKMMMMMRC